MQVKVCSRCKESKPLSAFGKCSKTKDGLLWHCKECQKKVGLKYRGKYPRNALTRGLIRALKRRPTSNPITSDELWQMWKDQGGRCQLTGVEMVWYGGNGRVLPNSISIDRIDSTKGYEKDNVRLICNCVNSFAGEMDDSEMLTYARLLVERHGNA